MNFRSAIVLISMVVFTGCGGGGTGQPIPKFGKTVKLLITGQSNGNSGLQNSALQDSLGQSEPPYAPPLSNAIVDGSFVGGSVVHPTPASPAIFGLAWLHIAELEPAHDFYITVVSQAGRSTQQQIDNHLYDGMLNALRAGRYDACLWVQGESDSGLHMSEDQTFNNMVQIINLSRMIQPDLIWYVALDGPADQATRRAQQRIITSGYAQQGPDVDVMRSNPAFVEPGGGEFAGAGLAEHGRLWHEILKSRF